MEGLESGLEPTRIQRPRLRFQPTIQMMGCKPTRQRCGSLMHQDEVASKEIQEILGHEDIQTTLNIYVKPNLKTLKGATDRLHNVLGKKFIAG